MLKRSLFLTTSAALALGLATIAHASLTTGVSDPGLAPTPRLDAHRVYAENSTPAPVTRSLSAASRSDTRERPQTGQAAPRVVEVPRADAPSQGYASSAADAGITARPERLSQVKPMPASQAPTSEALTASADRNPMPVVAKPPARASSQAADTARPAGYRAVRWSGGEGASWNAGRDAYSFSGMFGGCRIRGSAGPNGYRLDRAC